MLGRAAEDLSDDVKGPLFQQTLPVRIDEHKKLNRKPQEIIKSCLKILCISHRFPSMVRLCTKDKNKNKARNWYSDNPQS